MSEQALYEIANTKIVVPDGLHCAVNTLTQVQLVAIPSSTRRQGYFLSIRLRTIWDQNFTQVDMIDKLKKVDLPEGSDKTDPAKLLARNLELTIFWNGKTGKQQEAWFEVKQRGYFQKMQVTTDISPYFDLNQ